jgi:hypothetical protein
MLLRCKPHEHVSHKIMPTLLRSEGMLPFISRRTNDLLKKMAMGCMRGKPIRAAKPGDFRCKDCGAVAAKKKRLCKPKKVKK